MAKARGMTEEKVAEFPDSRFQGNICKIGMLVTLAITLSSLS
jgi:hypothetical protein